ncbi:ligase-associated DNA damage response DEXH box helicase [Methylobacillus arboreus]|uniref:ligase-associated DNA damage response DEXH box helicase n=1 Tax=Methylobacillus arboreus TaxID=755170 RepID=UPI001E2889BD|nr:ligase-associated DNA damage response DEXH box helicase [Methylobacillus arboreus]MCB5191351.1 ligase-associated DNA damage response DEXH box helicase [Methylobacillus arboreus]
MTLQTVPKLPLSPDAAETPDRNDFQLSRNWFSAHQWQPFPFQQQVWQAVASGQSGMLHATTGAGKTYAVWMAAIERFALKKPTAASAKKSGIAIAEKPAKRKAVTQPLTVLWITPMRALAADTERALIAPVNELNLDWSIALRTGDTNSAERSRQSKRLPTALITTPESLTLLLTRPDAADTFASLQMVVVDEWHELIGNKRGVQLQLALARLRRWRPQLITWGLSATLGNLQHAMEVLIPTASKPVLVQGKLEKHLLIDTLLPPGIERFPWAGHLGLRMLPQVVEQIESSPNSLIFTNTRSQCEIWYQALLEARPDWAGLIALHHGSLDRNVREWVETGLKEGTLKAVVCTSSLDLGVDFLPVERVLQIGSPKGVARLMQRAGRSGHAPGRASRLTVVPTHSLELIESVAAQDAIAARNVEPRESPQKPLDVLVQHLVTIALGGGFIADDLLAEVRSCYAYRHLTDEEWHWALTFVRHGGESLTAYPDYRRAIPDEQGVWHVPDAHLARRHRMSIGTIVSDSSMVVKFWSKGASGKSLGSVEENFIARLKPGDHFLFGGRLLELVRVHEMTAFVRKATGKKAAVPRWNGGRLPLSTELANAMVARMDAAAHGHFDGPEMQMIKPLLQVQSDWSALPTNANLLAESLHSREGWHLFLYPYAGRSVHLGLASLLAWRAGKHLPNTFSIAVNDYGLELLSATPVDWATIFEQDVFSTENLLVDVIGSLNAGELAQRRFREIARISGLVFAGFPSAHKSARQVQASSSLFYDVFRKYDPNNLLLTQAQEEVLQQELEIARLSATLQHLQTKQIQLMHIKRPTPFAFPLLVERFRESSSSEKLADRIARMVADLEKAAGAGAYIPQDTANAQAKFNVQEKVYKNRERKRKTGLPSDTSNENTTNAKRRRSRIISPKPRHGF